MQAIEGENKTERPMWAEKGGLDFEGRARWDAWTANKGMAAEKAKLLFVKVWRVNSQPPSGPDLDPDLITSYLCRAVPRPLAGGLDLHCRRCHVRSSTSLKLS